MNKAMWTTVAITGFGMAGAAQAGSISVDGLGGDVVMHSRSIAGVFGAASPNFTNSAMGAVHDSLHSDGIITDGMVTFVLADTDAGLSFITLVDDSTLGNDKPLHDSQIGMTTSAPSTASHFVNDEASDMSLLFDPGFGTQTAAGSMTWDSEQEGDGFAWAELGEGDYVSTNFSRGGTSFDSFPGLNESETFQFVSWNGAEWEIVAIGDFTVNDQFAFSFTVIPLPAPILMGLAGLVGVGLMRRRQIA